MVLIPFLAIMGQSIMTKPTPKEIVKSILSIPCNSIPSKRIPYGKNSRQFGNLRIPHTSAPHPVLVIVHGGCWITKFASAKLMSPFAEALTKRGVATWNIEYRCADNRGGGWPGTFKDIGAAIDYLRVLAPKYKLDLNRVVVMGHSAGGQLALWSGARRTFAKTNKAYVPHPLPLKAVIDLAGPTDLRKFLPMQEKCCGGPVLNQLFKTQHITPEHFAATSPYELLPLHIKQILITGKDDPSISVPEMQDYVDHAKMLGDQDVQLIVVENAAHFEVIDPRTKAWEQVRKVILSCFG